MHISIDSKSKRKKFFFFFSHFLTIPVGTVGPFPTRAGQCNNIPYKRSTYDASIVRELAPFYPDLMSQLHRDAFHNGTFFIRPEHRHIAKRLQDGSCACGGPACCAQDCWVGAWGEWSGCSATCGTGLRSRSRSVGQAFCGGTDCPHTVETEECFAGCCPQNCQPGEWSAWNCNAACGPGTATRTRSISAATCGGTCDAHASETQGCDAGCCPQPCVPGPWGDWGACSVSCGSCGFQTRSRSIQPAQCGGGCPDSSTSQNQDCCGPCCRQDCIINGWGEWSTCTAACGGGMQSRSRTITAPSCGGTCSESATVDSRPCNTGCCPVHCAITEWSPWTTCSPACGGGQQSRSRSITRNADCGGTACPTDLVQTQPCGAMCCAQDCQLTQWSGWTGCSASCGAGSQTRTRGLIVAASCGGSCGALSENQPCDAGCCPVNCQWSPFSEWTSCSKTCGPGSRQRSRSKTVLESCNGQCPGSSVETEGCNLGICIEPSDCVVSDWSSWTACSASCGPSGMRSRGRTIVALPVNGGAPCPTDLSASEACNTATCCPVACAVGAWGSWSSCSTTCDAGTRTRTRPVTTAAACGGATCPATTEPEACNVANCPVNCVMSAFTAWSTCSQACGAGEERRTRSVVTAAANGGTPCPAAALNVETRPCMVVACACAVSAWTPWSTCTKTCDDGVMTRTRTITAGAADCPALTENSACNLGACGTACELSPWSVFTACTATCGGGTQQRTRTVTKAATGNAAPCPGATGLVESQPCGTGCCPASCAVGGWAAWTSCSVTCGSGGKRTRTRAATVQPACGGAACPELAQTEDCSAAAACPVACSLSAWTNWGMCSQTCGAGEERRTRSVVVAPAAGGAACEALSEARACTRPACSCEVSAWSAWSACSLSCGTGMQTRQRMVTKSAGDCPVLSEAQTCTRAACAVNCATSTWSEWSVCTASCGGGRRQRTRAVTMAASGNGTACPELIVSENCNEQTCVVAGLPCGEFRDCFSCVDGGKTAPRVCQFCVQNAASATGVRLGVCQSKFNVDGNATSGQTACAEGFDLRVTNAPQCAMLDGSATSASTGGGTETSGTAAPVVVSMVNATTVFAMLGQNSSVATLNVTLPNGITFLATAVSANESDSDVALQLDNGGLGVRSILAENDTARVRKGFSIVFTFRFPVSFQFLALREFADASDVGSLEFKHAEGSQRAGQPVGAIVTIRSAESRHADVTAAGFTEYTIAAVGDESEFTIEAFEFSALGSDALTGNGMDMVMAVGVPPATSGPAGFEFDAMTIGLIAGGGALCCLIVLVISIIVVRSRRSGPKHASPSSSLYVNGSELMMPQLASQTSELDSQYLPLPKQMSGEQSYVAPGALFVGAGRAAPEFASARENNDGDVYNSARMPPARMPPPPGLYTSPRETPHAVEGQPYLPPPSQTSFLSSFPPPGYQSVEDIVVGAPYQTHNTHSTHDFT
jgi:hypothetical protein